MGADRLADHPAALRAALPVTFRLTMLTITEPGIWVQQERVNGHQVPLHRPLAVDLPLAQGFRQQYGAHLPSLTRVRQSQQKRKERGGSEMNK